MEGESTSDSRRNRLGSLKQAPSACPPATLRTQSVFRAVCKKKVCTALRSFTQAVNSKTDVRSIEQGATECNCTGGVGDGRQLVLWVSRCCRYSSRTGLSQPEEQPELGLARISAELAGDRRTRAAGASVVSDAGVGNREGVE